MIEEFDERLKIPIEFSSGIYFLEVRDKKSETLLGIKKVLVIGVLMFLAKH